MHYRWNNIRYFFFSVIYDVALQWFYKNRVKQLIEKVNRQEGSRVFEVGVGTGISIPFYAPGKTVTAIDCSAAMLKRARKKAQQHPEVKVELMRKPAEDHQADLQQFDQVVFCNTLSVVANPKQVLQQYFQELKEGGSIFILNHFTPETGLLHLLDKLLVPVGRVLGFKSFFPLSSIVNPATMTAVTSSDNGYWRIVEIKKEAATA